MRRRTPKVILVAALAVATAVPAGAGTASAQAGTAPRSQDPYGAVWNILPPGQSGTITATDLATVIAGDPNRVAVDGKNAPPNFANQLEMYDALTRQRPGTITRADIERLYKPEGFTPAHVTKQETPEQGVTISWDGYGVPYIKGTTYDGV
ncbi:MAG TPA: hypothetical protein VFJ09_09675, partial [Nocardioidaceae bacterium]|nr:hypothetical protein [Nocardioidaceae bacterium]